MTRFTQAEHYLVELVEGEGNWCDSSSEEEDEIEDSDELESDDSDELEIDESDDSDYTTETDDDTDSHISDLIVSDN